MLINLFLLMEMIDSMTQFNQKEWIRQGAPFDETSVCLLVKGRRTSTKDHSGEYRKSFFYMYFGTSSRVTATRAIVSVSYYQEDLLMAYREPPIIVLSHIF